MNNSDESNTRTYSVITGSGSYIPVKIVKNEDFLDHAFYGADGEILAKPNDIIIRQFEDITGIRERHYAADHKKASDIALEAAKKAIQSSGIDPEKLDYIIFAHNFGDLDATTRKPDMVPALASRVKAHLGIKNPETVAYDLIFGCSGWLQGVIQADYFIRSGDARSALVVGAETLSRIYDPHDRDGMIYADGAGAVVLEARQSDTPIGIIAHATHTESEEHAFILENSQSYKKGYAENDHFLKMKGRLLYEHALKSVPLVVKKSLMKAGVSVGDVHKILIHQANKKMVQAIVKRLFEEYNLKEVPEDILPLIISWTGNTSVASIPTLYDLIVHQKLEGHRIQPGDTLVFAAVGAGVNINSMVYKAPV